VDPENPFLEGVYNITALHSDSEPLNCAWMAVLEGKKRFYLLPDSARIAERENSNPCFVSSLAVQVMNLKGLRVANLGPGDLLYFPGQYYHEVHNLTPSSLALTNSAIWPED
jgi:oxalate decarboxylase/phosphoglucose isomerase-like protein (cupin superfamily)